LLVTIARAEKLLRLTASLLPENRAMLAIARKCGFELRQSGLEGAWKVELVL
jgi:RimJ/RimL family protein N-acetyltransferase